MIKNIIIFILIFGFIGAVVFLDIPGVQEILKTKKQIEIEENLLLERQDLLAKIERLKDDYEENNENFKRVSYILPSTQDIPSLIVQLEALALEGGLILENIEIFTAEQQQISSRRRIPGQEQVSSKNYKILNINLSLTGDYSALKNLLTALEENIRLMDINSIAFSSQSTEEIQFFDFNLSLQTYYQ